jgi:hypothetical protein
MKKITLTILIIVVNLLMSPVTFAQAPYKMSYQAIIRNSANELVANKTVGVKISIVAGSVTGPAVFSETHTPTTNINGLASLEIGGGTPKSGKLSLINWVNGPFFVKTETDPEGGTNYTITGTTQLLSSPYALYANSSGSSEPGPTGPEGPEGPEGEAGPAGPAGAVGKGVPAGGTANQVLVKVDATNYNTAWATPAGGNGAKLDLIATKIAATQELSVANGNNTGDLIVYENTGTAPTLGSYSSATSTYTVGAGQSGLYYIQAQSKTIDAPMINNTINQWLYIDINNSGPAGVNNIQSPYISIGATNLTTGSRAMGYVAGAIFLNAGDTVNIKGLSVSNSLRAIINNNGSCKLTIVKLN